MRKSPRRAVLDDAGRLYLLKQELARARAERERLDEQIGRLEARVLEAEGKFGSSFDQAVRHAVPGSATVEEPAPEPAITPGKLPHRILSRRQTAPSGIYTAAALSTELGVDDIQQVRTALARLVSKGLVRRTDIKGEFTI